MESKGAMSNLKRMNGVEYLTKKPKDWQSQVGLYSLEQPDMICMIARSPQVSLLKRGKAFLKALFGGASCYCLSLMSARKSFDGSLKR